MVQQGSDRVALLRIKYTELKELANKVKSPQDCPSWRWTQMKIGETYFIKRKDATGEAIFVRCICFDLDGRKMYPPKTNQFLKTDYSSVF